MTVEKKALPVELIDGLPADYKPDIGQLHAKAKIPRPCAKDIALENEPGDWDLSPVRQGQGAVAGI